MRDKGNNRMSVEHLDKLAERFLTGLLDNDVYEMLLVAKPGTSWRQIHFIDAFLRDNGYGKLTATPGMLASTSTAAMKTSEDRALEHELASRFETMKVRIEADQRTWQQHLLVKEAAERRNFASLVAFHELQDAQATKLIEAQCSSSFPSTAIETRQTAYATSMPLVQNAADQFLHQIALELRSC